MNDGSLDNSLSICKTRQELDNRIKIINKENGGVSSARNCGLDNATGKYVAFCDSDDTMCLDMIERLVHEIKKNNVKMVMCGYYSYIENDAVNLLTNGNSRIVNIENTADLNEFIFSPWFFNISAVWNKLYLREAIKDLRFNETISWGEDQIFNHEFLLKNPVFYYLKDMLYNYNHKNSTLSKARLQNYFVETMKLCSHKAQFVKNLKNKDNNFMQKYYFEIIKPLFDGMYYEVKYNGKNKAKELLNEYLEKDFVKNAIENYKPKGLKSKITFYCVKNKKISLANFLIKARRFLKGM